MNDILKQGPTTAKATEMREPSVSELISTCYGPKGVDNLRREAKDYHDRLLSLCQGQPENVMALREFAARMMAFGVVRGAQLGHALSKQPGNTIVGEILKSATVVKLLLKTPRASTREICSVLDDKHIRLPWNELRKKGEIWTKWAQEPRVKMAISHARRAAEQLSEDESWLRLINDAEAEFRAEKAETRQFPVGQRKEGRPRDI